MADESRSGGSGEWSTQARQQAGGLGVRVGAGQHAAWRMPTTQTSPPTCPLCRAPTSDSARTIFQSSRASFTLATAVCKEQERAGRGQGQQRKLGSNMSGQRRHGGRRDAAGGGSGAARQGSTSRAEMSCCLAPPQLTLVDCGRPSKFTYVAYLRSEGRRQRLRVLRAHTSKPCSVMRRQASPQATMLSGEPPAGNQSVNHRSAGGPSRSLLGVGGGRQHNVGARGAAVAMVALQLERARAGCRVVGAAAARARQPRGRGSTSCQQPSQHCCTAQPSQPPNHPRLASPSPSKGQPSLPGRRQRRRRARRPR